MEKDNNRVILVGTFVGEWTYDHSVCGENFGIINMHVSRTSGAIDVLPVLVSERIMQVEKISFGINYRVEGHYRSFNEHHEVRNKLVLYVFANNITRSDAEAQERDNNEIVLNGYVCKQPVYRMTPLGREIGDIMLAVNRAYGKSDYIPCIVWGRNARYVKKLRVGDNIRITGRIQSREYSKRISETESVTKVAYEVSASRIDYVMEQEEDQNEKNSCDM